jgi:hypothetical protein
MIDSGEVPRSLTTTRHTGRIVVRIARMRPNTAACSSSHLEFGSGAAMAHGGKMADLLQPQLIDDGRAWL